MEPGTYIRPHRHRHTFELLLPLKGRFVVLNFDDHGVVTNRVGLGESCTMAYQAIISAVPGWPSAGAQAIVSISASG
jgi:cupin fold WbuC family metalloprotein